MRMCVGNSLFCFCASFNYTHNVLVIELIFFCDTSCFCAFCPTKKQEQETSQTNKKKKNDIDHKMPDY